MKYTRKPKQCSNCMLSFPPTGNNQKVCADCAAKVKVAYMKKYQKERRVYKGYSQSGENNNNWKGGIGIYRQIKKATCCEKCFSVVNLLIHHKDENRYNNAIENLICLCRRCHQLEHRCWEQLPKGEKLAKLKSAQAMNAKRKNGKFSK